MNVHHNAQPHDAWSRTNRARHPWRPTQRESGCPSRAGLSERSVRKWLARFQAEGAADYAIVLRDLAVVPDKLPPRRWPWCWPCAGCVCQASRSRVERAFPGHAPGLASLMGSRACRFGAGSSGRALSARAPRRTASLRHQKARPNRAAQSPRDRQSAGSVGGRMGVSSTSPSMMLSLGLRSDMPDECRKSAVIFLERARLTRLPGHQSHSAHERQRLLLRSRLFRAAFSASASATFHPPLTAAHQRQSRTLHPDFLPRMGLCRLYSNLAHRADASPNPGSIATIGTALIPPSNANLPSPNLIFI